MKRCKNTKIGVNVHEAAVIAVSIFTSQGQVKVGVAQL